MCECPCVHSKSTRGIFSTAYVFIQVLSKAFNCVVTHKNLHMITHTDATNLFSTL